MANWKRDTRNVSEVYDTGQMIQETRQITIVICNECGKEYRPLFTEELHR